MAYVKVTVFLPIAKKAVLARQYTLLSKLRDKLFDHGVFDVDWVNHNTVVKDIRQSDIYIDLTDRSKYQSYGQKHGYVYIKGSLNLTQVNEAIFDKELRRAIELVRKKTSKTKDSKLPTLYHISFDNNLKSVLRPRQPEGSDINLEENDGKLVEDLPPRVSFSSSIEGCFRAITPNITHIIEEAGNRPLLFRVYMLSGRTTPYKCMRPVDLVESKKVHDAAFTQEYTFMKNVSIRNIADIEIKVNRKKKIKYGFFGSPPVGEDTGWAYDMTYKVVKFKSAGYLNLKKYDFSFDKIV